MNSPSAGACLKALKVLLEKLALEKWYLSRERLRVLRSLEVLERIGSSEARQVIQILAGGAPGAQLTREAKAALRRLGEKP
jgi:hypothetical protein